MTSYKLMTLVVLGVFSCASLDAAYKQQKMTKPGSDAPKRKLFEGFKQKAFEPIRTIKKQAEKLVGKQEKSPERRLIEERLKERALMEKGKVFDLGSKVLPRQADRVRQLEREAGVSGQLPLPTRDVPERPTDKADYDVNKAIKGQEAAQKRLIKEVARIERYEELDRKLREPGGLTEKELKEMNDLSRKIVTARSDQAKKELEEASDLLMELRVRKKAEQDEAAQKKGFFERKQDALDKAMAEETSFGENPTLKGAVTGIGGAIGGGAASDILGVAASAEKKLKGLTPKKALKEAGKGARKGAEALADLVFDD